MASPMSMPSMSTSMPRGMLVASASTGICTSCWSSMPSPGAISPVTRTGTSTVTFSPLRTRIRSTCSRKPLTGSRCTALGRAISLPFLSPSRRNSTFGVFSASIRSCPGRLRWRVSVPWPYSTAGTLPSRRLRRAAPLPNSVRASAAILTSGTVLLLVSTCDARSKCSRQMRRVRMRQRGGPAERSRQPASRPGPRRVSACGRCSGGLDGRPPWPAWPSSSRLWRGRGRRSPGFLAGRISSGRRTGW